MENLEVMDPGVPGGDYIYYLCSLTGPYFSQNGIGQSLGFDFVNQFTSCSINSECIDNQPTLEPTNTPTATSTPPLATFSFSSGSNFSSTPGSTGSTFNPTITVEYGTATIRLSVTVQSGYQGDTTLTIPNVGSFSPSPAQGAGQSTFVDFTLGVGTYGVVLGEEIIWVVQAISDGTGTPVTATLSQV
jgi:hypothetical protein